MVIVKFASENFENTHQIMIQVLQALAVKVSTKAMPLYKFIHDTRIRRSAEPALTQALPRLTCKIRFDHLTDRFYARHHLAEQDIQVLKIARPLFLHTMHTVIQAPKVLENTKNEFVTAHLEKRTRMR